MRSQSPPAASTLTNQLHALTSPQRSSTNAKPWIATKGCHRVGIGALLDQALCKQGTPVSQRRDRPRLR